MTHSMLNLIFHYYVQDEKLNYFHINHRVGLFIRDLPYRSSITQLWKLRALHASLGLNSMCSFHLW